MLDGEVGAVGSLGGIGTLLLRPHWKEQVIAEEAKVFEYTKHLVVLCELGEGRRESLETKMSEIRCLWLQSNQSGIEERFRTYSIQVLEEIQTILNAKTTGKVLIQIVVPARGEQQLFRALSGLLKTMYLENPEIAGQLVEVDSEEDEDGLLNKLRENSRSPEDAHIYYSVSSRHSGIRPDASVSAPLCPDTQNGKRFVLS